MQILDSIRKTKEKQKDHTTPPAAGHTLTEILQDKNKSHLLGKLLERDGNEDLASRLVKGELEESDIALLEKQRKIFSEKLVQSEKVEKLLTKENVIDFARNNPDFEKIINLVGPEKAAQVIQKQLKEISISDEGRFNSVVIAMEEYDNYKKGEYKKLNDKIEKICENGKFTPQEYADALAIEDPKEKTKALYGLANKKYGVFKKAVNYIFQKDIHNTATLRQTETSLEDSIADLNVYHGVIGNQLFLSVSGNDSMRNALFSSLVNEKVPEEPKSGFRDANKEAFNETLFNEAWEEYKTKENYSKKTPLLQNKLKQGFIKEQVKASKESSENGGFWHGILATINESLIKSKKNKLK